MGSEPGFAQNLGFSRQILDDFCVFHGFGVPKGAWIGEKSELLRNFGGESAGFGVWEEGKEQKAPKNSRIWGVLPQKFLVGRGKRRKFHCQPQLWEFWGDLMGFNRLAPSQRGREKPRFRSLSTSSCSWSHVWGKTPRFWAKIPWILDENTQTWVQTPGF